MSTFDADVLVHLNIRTRVTGVTDDEATDVAISNVRALLHDLGLNAHIAGEPEVSRLDRVNEM